MIVMALMLSAFLTPTRAQTASDIAAIADAYTYLLARTFVVRQEHTDLKELGVACNTIKYNPLGSADFVNPNLTSPISKTGSPSTTRRPSASRSV